MQAPSERSRLRLEGEHLRQRGLGPEVCQIAPPGGRPRRTPGCMWIETASRRGGIYSEVPELSI